MFSEQDVDRELKAALSVSPSADFEARVLQRVEADRPSYWAARYGWLAAAALPRHRRGRVLKRTNRTPSVVAPARAPASYCKSSSARRRQSRCRGLTLRPDADTIEPPRVQTVRASRSAPRARGAGSHRATGPDGGRAAPGSCGQ